MAVTDLTNTKWLFNNDVTLSEFGVVNNNTTFDLTFINDGVTYYGFEVRNKAEQDNGIRYYDGDHAWWRYNVTNGWADSSYKTIEITGGTDATNADLIAGITANATQIVEPSSDVIETTISVGTSLLADASVGTTKLLKAYIGNHLIFERVGSNFQTADDKLLLTSNGDIFNVQEASGYSVSVHVTETDLNDKNYLRIYDGQDTSGTLLHESTTSVSGQTLNLICTSGYLYISASGSSVNLQITDIVGDIIRNGYVMTISSNGSFSLSIIYDF